MSRRNPLSPCGPVIECIESEPDSLLLAASACSLSDTGSIRCAITLTCNRSTHRLGGIDISIELS
jgi:hypothetical protein